MSFLAHTMQGAPPAMGWLAPAVLAMLFAAAAIDAFTARIPDPLIFFGLLLTTAAQGFQADWPVAARHLLIGFAAGVLVAGLNHLWYRFKKHDALGMGDAKWTMLAAACFGPLPAAVAWGLGAWLGLAWIGFLKLLRKPATRVHFAPFLFVGLVVGIYWLRLR
ncbi:MAG TPA: prepilin peptidase [Alphaproteobacteria bacterium]|nr:prepilin peptidase [Alphaproteobacteria bacterium]